MNDWETTDSSEGKGGGNADGPTLLIVLIVILCMFYGFSDL